MGLEVKKSSHVVIFYRGREKATMWELEDKEKDGECLSDSLAGRQASCE